MRSCYGFWVWPLVLLLGGLLAGCGGSTTAAPSATSALAQLVWCQGPAIQFDDVGTKPTAVITTWDQARPLLGFDPLLPAALPTGTCLLFAGGTLHDPIFGGRFSITYRLPGGGALSLAEAQLAQGQAGITCGVGGASANSSVPITTCRQNQSGVDITLSSTASEAQIRAWLGALETGITWLPISTPKTTPSPTPGKP